MAKTIVRQNIMLPQGIDMSKWASIACDQYNAQPKYWQKLESYVGDAPSTLHITFPEIYLNDNQNTRIEQINKNMYTYIEQNILKPVDGMILVERTTEKGGKRIGLMVSIDIESYDWKRVRVPVRATEDTIVERLPVRVKIRRDAPVELPHTLLLADDRDRAIIEPLYAKKDSLAKLYDFDLNMNGGHINGYLVPYSDNLDLLFANLLSHDTQVKKYGSDVGIQFVVGDGNHSIATAKVWWDELKLTLSPEERENHPARFFLLELINIYDEALDFHPIHRLLKNCNDDIFELLSKELSGEGKLNLITVNGKKSIPCPLSPAETIATVQVTIENYCKLNTNATIEYIHGDDNLKEVVTQNTDLGILLPYFDKKELFGYVANVGNLPKKAFSIGNTNEKRFYLETKSIISL